MFLQEQFTQSGLCVDLDCVQVHLAKTSQLEVSSEELEFSETAELGLGYCSSGHCGGSTVLLCTVFPGKELKSTILLFQAGFNLRKVNKHIKFPEILDLAPFCTLKCKNVAEEHTRVLYSLYGVVEHSGTMRSGHYTAYAKTRTANTHLSNLVLHGDIPQDFEMESTKGQWFHISDTHVQAVPTTKVLNSQAYLLFYERIL